MLTRYVIMFANGNYVEQADDYSTTKETEELEKARLFLNPYAAHMISVCVRDTKVIEVTFSPTLLREVNYAELEHGHDYTREAR